MPGPTLGILAMLSAVLAAVLLLSTLCCTGLTALPGFGVQCRVVCDEAGQQQQRAAAAAPAVVQFNPAAGVYAPQVVAWGAPKEGAPQFMLPVGGQGQPPPPPPPPPSPPPH